MNFEQKEKDTLTYLTAHALPTVIQHQLHTYKNESNAVFHKSIGEIAANIANAALDKIEQINQKKLENVRCGETNGWYWEIHPWDVNYLDGIVLPDTTWYVNVHGKEQYLTADQLDCEAEAISAIKQFCSFHPQGRINPGKPIEPFKIIPFDH